MLTNPELKQDNQVLKTHYTLSYRLLLLALCSFPNSSCLIPSKDSNDNIVDNQATLFSCWMFMFHILTRRDFWSPQTKQFWSVWSEPTKHGCCVGVS